MIESYKVLAFLFSDTRPVEGNVEISGRAGRVSCFDDRIDRIERLRVKFIADTHTHTQIRRLRVTLSAVDPFLLPWSRRTPNPRNVT